MHDERRIFERSNVKGAALIYNDKLESTYLLDIGLGGMKVSSKLMFGMTEPLWVEFTLFNANNEMIFGKRARATVVHSEFNPNSRRYTLGFRFLSLTEFQRDVINSALNH